MCSCCAWTALRNIWLNACCGKGFPHFTLHCCNSSFQAHGILSPGHSSACSSRSCTRALAGGIHGLTLITMTDILLRLRQRLAG